MNSKKGSSLLETKRRNRTLIKETIFKFEPITRTDIAEKLQLTLPTITTSVNELLDEKIVEEIPIPDRKLPNVMGRKPLAVGFRAGCACTVGVELGPYATTVILMNIKGTILASSVEAPASEDYPHMLENVSEQIRKIMDSEKPMGLLGVGIGLPGFIESEKGIIRSNFRKGWTGKHLTADLEEKLGVPVIIDNNVRLRAAGYELSYHGNSPDTFAYFYVSKGIACPLMIKDDVVAGYTAGAGEIGHMIICAGTNANGEAVQKSVEDLAGEKAIVQHCRSEVNLGRALKLKELADANGNFGIKQVLEAQTEGDPDVCRIFETSIEYLGIALANVVNLINPGFVVVDGYIMQNEKNRELLKQASKSKFFGLNEEEVKLVFEPFDILYGAKGAAYTVIRRLFLEK